MNPSLASLILYIAAQYGVSPYVVAAVIETESKFNTLAVGEIGELGLMQLRPKYFLLPGESPALLHDPEQNIRRGVRYIASLKNRCIYKKDFQFVVCFNAGVTGARSIKYPARFPYYMKVKASYEKLKAEKVFEAK